MKILILSLVLSSFALLSAQPNAQFEAVFTFSESSINSQDIILGYDPFGSDGLNTGLGETIVPQVPEGNFGVRCQLPSDTSLYTVKDIRFGCGQPFYYEHLIDLSYDLGFMEVDWEWGSFELLWVLFINPNNGETLATFESNYDSSFYEIPALDKIIIGIQYNGPLSWPSYHLTSPNGGEIIEAGGIYTITWTRNFLVPGMSLELSTDSGNSWEYIVGNINTNQNSYDWEVPLINSENCLIRIGDYPCAYDISDSLFTITYPVNTESESRLPGEFSLSQNYPNPFNPITKIKFTIPQTDIPLQRGARGGLVTLKVFDVLGNEIATLFNEEKPAGEYEVEFNAVKLPSGIYFYQLKSDSFIQTKKMVLMK